MLHEVEAQSIVRSCFALLMGPETKSSNILTLRRYTDLYICKAFSTTWTMVQVLVSKLSPISTYRSMVKPIKKPQDVFVKPKCCTNRRICATKSGVLFEVVGGSRTLPNMVSDVVDGSSFLPFFLFVKIRRDNQVGVLFPSLLQRDLPKLRYGCGASCSCP